MGLAVDLRGVLDLLLPAVCLECGVLLRAAGPLCTGCGVGAAVLPAALVRVGATEAVLPYDAPWSDALTRLKFGGRLAFAGPLGRLLASSPRLYTSSRGTRWDAVVPIPLHWRRRFVRGFDQTLLLARFASRCEQAPPVWARALRRTRATPPQSRLPAASRPANVAGAFSVPSPRRVAGRALLVVDDVTTTGSTLIAAMQALLAAGAREVEGLALLRTLP